MFGLQGGVAKATVLMRGSDADISDVEQSMHATLPTIVMSDTGGSADAIAIKLNESLKSQEAQDKETENQRATMPYPPFREKTQEEHLEKLYAQIERGRQGTDPPPAPESDDSPASEGDGTIENPMFSPGCVWPSRVTFFQSHCTEPHGSRCSVSERMKSKVKKKIDPSLDPAFDCWVVGGCVIVKEP